MASPLLRRENWIPLALAAGVVAFVFSTRRKPSQGGVTAGPGGVVITAQVPGVPTPAPKPRPIVQVILTRDTTAYSGPPTRGGAVAMETIKAGTLLGLRGGGEGSFVEVTYPFPALRNAKRAWVDANHTQRTTPPAPGEGTVDDAGTVVDELRARFEAQVAKPLNVDGVDENDAVERVLKEAGRADLAAQLRARRDQLFEIITRDAEAAIANASMAETSRLLYVAELLASRGYFPQRDRVVNAIGARQAVLRATTPRERIVPGVVRR